MPDEVKKRQAKGKVVRVGLSDDPIEVKEGQTVWFKRFAGEEIKDGSENLLFVSYRDILGVYE